MHAGKKIVRVYDYVDNQVPMLARMFARRVRGYKSLGYVIEEFSYEEFSKLALGSGE